MCGFFVYVYTENNGWLAVGGLAFSVGRAAGTSQRHTSGGIFQERKYELPSGITVSVNCIIFPANELHGLSSGHI
jgi:hypothetical protein